MSATGSSTRNRSDGGRYDFDMDRVCTCGHELGQHYACGPRGCGATEETEDCTCEGFKPVNRSKARCAK